MIFRLQQNNHHNVMKYNKDFFWWRQLYYDELSKLFWWDRALFSDPMRCLWPSAAAGAWWDTPGQTPSPAWLGQTAHMPPAPPCNKGKSHFNYLLLLIKERLLYFLQAPLEDADVAQRSSVLIWTTKLLPWAFYE